MDDVLSQHALAFERPRTGESSVLAAVLVAPNALQSARPAVPNNRTPARTRARLPADSRQKLTRITYAPPTTGKPPDEFRAFHTEREAVVRAAGSEIDTSPGGTSYATTCARAWDSRHCRFGTAALSRAARRTRLPRRPPHRVQCATLAPAKGRSKDAGTARCVASPDPRASDRSAANVLHGSLKTSNEGTFQPVY